MGYWSHQREIWFHTGVGRFYRIVLCLWCFALTVAVPPLAAGFLLYGFYLASQGLFGHIFKWFAFMGIPTPTQLFRGYKKVWHSSVKNGVVTKVIKAHPSGPTP